MSLIESLTGLLLEGRPVHTGIAIFTPRIDLNGDIEVKVKVDKRILAALNNPGAFTGQVRLPTARILAKPVTIWSPSGTPVTPKTR